LLGTPRDATGRGKRYDDGTYLPASVMSLPNHKSSLLAIVGPGMIVAATGVGAGDLATGAFTGSMLGVAVLWAVVVGATLKYTINEGLARWQLVTGQTLLEGVARHLGRWAIALFLAYLVFWSYFVASILMSACGAAMHALAPIKDAQTDKVIYGLAHSAIAVALIWLGGYRWFERVMSACVAVMFVVVVGAAIAIGPDWAAVLRGLVFPQIPHADGQGVSWTIALMGGIGGTVTVLGYGYWIREEGRTGESDIRTCRLDLATGYAMTALFGIGMVIIGSELLAIDEDPSKGTRFVHKIGEEMSARLGAIGPAVRWAFLLGAWAAVFSSLLGVWQSVPLIFADSWRLLLGREGDAKESADLTRSRAYLVYQLALASIPAVGLFYSFVHLQKFYSIVGACFIPILAAVLLALNSRKSLLGQWRNSWWSLATLVAALALFAWAAALEIQSQLAG
jgi:Mn2+/Fe2+ NRAMP family transporter